MYKQTLYKIENDYIKPKVLKRMNRYKKWEYGYNAEHDIVEKFMISRILRSLYLRQQKTYINAQIKKMSSSGRLQNIQKN